MKSYSVAGSSLLSCQLNLMAPLARKTVLPHCLYVFALLATSIYITSLDLENCALAPDAIENAGVINRDILFSDGLDDLL